ncbi:MAG: YceI family protein [Candidatus Eremiobacteraeota bacterium]|nr:YceI family protein [Candidatus Eremiobacteraeota bacterium]MBV9055089.1 YceI family protein [Candidatus Eremiobacteraeota bacterium]MBV9698841.1 YceI family protein [Candidatus Eremiobacteraeota bacterium]
MTSHVQEKAVYALDPAHTTVEFVVRHLMITRVRGRFTAFTGEVELAPDSDLPLAVAAHIEAGSIDTREEQRDAHLRSADFFDVEKYPELAFESTRIAGGPDAFTIEGKLTIRGVTRDVSLAGSFEGRTRDPWGGVRVGYSAHTTINRKDYGLTWNAALETGGVVVGDEVRIELNVEAVLQA